MAHYHGDDGYVREGGRPTDQRRRLRAALTLSLLFVLLLGAFGIALGFDQGWFGDRSPRANPTPECVPWSEPPPTSDITVSVYNTTDRKGVAAQVASALGKQKFRLAGVGNDPMNQHVDGVGQVRYGKGNEAQAKVLQQRFPGAQLVANQRTDGIVDIAIGSRFTAVATPKAPVRPTDACS